MPQTPAGWGLVLVGVLFVGFLLLKSRISFLPRDPDRDEARKRIRELKRRAKRARGDKAEKARLWRQAAVVAREDLERPRLAASFAHRATRFDPDDVAAMTLMVESFRAAKRYRAAEKFLWRRLDGPPGPGYDRAFEELLALYEGPMRRRERAQALRAMRARASEA